MFSERMKDSKTSLVHTRARVSIHKNGRAIYIYIYKIFLYCPTSPNLSPSLSSLPPPLPIPPFLPSRSLNPALQTRTTHLEPWVRAGQPNDSSFCTANRTPSFQHFLLQMFAVSCWSTDRVPVLSMRFEVEKRYEKE